MPAARKETNPETIALFEMASWSSRVGWPVKSLPECFETIEHVTAVARNKSKRGTPFMALAEISGALSFFHFPCIDPLPGNRFAGHSHSPVAIRFFNDDTQIISAGASDHCLIQWRHFLVSSAHHQDVQSFLDSLCPNQPSQMQITNGDIASSMLAPTKWRPSSKIFQEATQAPNFVFQLEHVYGYRGHDMKGNLLFLHRKNGSSELTWDGHILYHVAGVAVIHNTKHNLQRRLVDLGLKSITSQALSPDALRVGTGEGGDNPAVVVWRASDGLITNRFQGFHKHGVVAICFSVSQGSGHVMTVGGDEFHKLALYDLDDTVAASKGAQPIAWRAGGPTDIISIGCYEVDKEDVYVTIGVRHIRCWRLQVSLDSGNQCTLEYDKADFFDFESYLTFVCVTFAHDLVVIGADNGSIYLMSGNRIVSVFTGAHQGLGGIGVPVLDLDIISDELVSCGSDGKIKFWKFTSKDYQVQLTEQEGGLDIRDFMKQAKNKNQVVSSAHAFHPPAQKELVSSVRSVKCIPGLQDPDDLQMLIGTGSNEIVLSSRQSRKHNIIMQGHHGGVINAVAAHPSKMLFVTGLITHPDPLQSTSHTPPPFSSFTTPAPLFPLLLVPPAAR
jgi:WD40 repeat protein